MGKTFQRCLGALVALLMVAGSSSAGATTIGVGDVAIIGLHTDSPDQFAWVPLINLDAGDQLFFTDTVWNAGEN